MTQEQCQDQLVKEDPSMLKKVVEKEPNMFTWNHRCKKTENPFASVDICPEVKADQFFVQARHIAAYQDLDHLAMLEKPRESLVVDFPHAVVSDQGHEEPEGKRFRAVQEQLRHDKVHSLDVADLPFEIGKCDKDAP